MTSRIKSVTFKKGKKGHIEIRTEKKDGDREEEFVLRSTEEPDPAVSAAFADAATEVGEMIGLPPNWADELVVTGVSYSISKSTGVKGAVITCSCHVDCFDSALTFNTPHMPFQPYGEGNGGCVMPEPVVKVLTHIEDLAQKFLKGERAQAEMFLIRDGKQIAGDQGEEAGA